MKKVLLSIALLVTLLLSQQTEAQPKQTTPSFFDLYDQNRKEQIPNYISLDFILTANYLFKQQSITQMEQEILYPKFKKLAYGLKANLLKAYSPSKKEALAFVLVLNELLGNQSADVPVGALRLAKEELKLINRHQGIVLSPIAKVKLDYSQYKVRGKYTQNSDLTAYFLALKYMGYMPFMVNPHSATGVTPTVANQQIANAQLIALALKPLMGEYQTIEKALEKLSGKGDDLSITNLLETEALAPNMARLKPSVPSIRKYLNTLKFPKISERIIDTSRIKKEDIPKASLALKLLPSRFTPDSYIFSQLTYPHVGQLEGQKNKLTSMIDGKMVRGYPTIMDLSAVLVGKNPKESNYQGYTQQIAKLKKAIQPNLKSIYSYDFAIYHKLLKQNRINSFKGYYTQSRYIMNLYQKQSYTGGLKSIFIDERKKAYLEQDIRSILDLLIKEDRLLPNSKTFTNILERLMILDKKRNKFNREDVAFLNNLDSKFKSILEDKDGPIEVDIHTNPVEGRVLYEVLKEPFVRDINGFRGAFYQHVEEMKAR
ncbi:MAG: Unknown protein [uncultured Sulfurovum sp.]|uniref:Uncharacterized protein n=1 Tax=uncultured Sulfurovum sp. TaxID=269237 RepID=A0A6S6T8B1_9BACT|nr:MAG: Unknown protein [uncultured Sulfurovum sp.]